MTRRSRTAPLAGVITGLRMAARSLEPSLMPRSAVDQGLIMAGSFATGYIAGSTAARVVGVVPVLGSKSTLRAIGVAAAAAQSAQSIVGADGHDSRGTTESSVWADTGAEILGAVAVAGAASNGNEPVLGLLGGLAVATSVFSDTESAVQVRDDNVDARYLATAAGTAVGVVAAVAGVLGAVRLSGRIARTTTGRTGFSGAAMAAGVSLGVGCALAVGAKVAAARIVGRLAAHSQAVEVAYANAPETTHVSGSPYSLVPYTSMGLQGRRLVSVVTSSETINDVMGQTARHDPVRVFVGIETADSIDERVEIAIQELRRAGGFDRSRIIAASPSGTGYVNYITIEAAELMALGDIAAVAIQYGDLPSMLSMNKVELASATYRALVERLRSEIDELDREILLFAYGESLGSQTGQNGIELIDNAGDAPVDGALWVGTPHGTNLFIRLTSQEGTPVFDRPSQLTDYISDATPAPQVTYLNHDNDPVVRFTPSMFHRRPDWLATSGKGRGMNPHQRWLPGVAFWQGLIDTKNAATIVPGAFHSTGHDYRSDLAEFIRVAYDFRDVTDQQMASIEEQLRRSEVVRSAKISEGVVQSA